jgi:glycogen operon protein
MILAGDEFARTQQGNNNAYCQDNEVSWLDWEGIDERCRDLIGFVRRLIGLRHSQPILRRRRFLSGAYNPELEVKDVTWLTPTGEEMTADHWRDPMARCLGVLLDGRAQPTGIRRRGTDVTLLLVINAHHDVVNFKLIEVTGGSAWMLRIDTNQPELEDPMMFPFGAEYQVTGRSLLLLEARRARPLF